MTTHKQFNIGGGKGGPLGSFGPVIMLILGLVLLYFVAKGIFTLLWWAALPLFILTLFIDHKVVIDYGKFVLKLLKENPLMGIVAIVLTGVGYPVVSGFLFFKALMKRQFKKVVEQHKPKEEEFTTYEEISEAEDFLQLPEITKEKQAPPKQGNEYDNLFD